MKEAIALRADDQVNQGQYAEALSSFIELYEKYDAPCETNLGWLYNQLEIYDKSEFFYKKGVDAGDSYAMHALAGLYVSLDRLDDAKALYIRAVENGRPECIHCLAKVFWKLRDFDQSRVFLEQAIQFDGSPIAKRDLAFLLMKGKFGFFEIPKGILMYVKNFSDLMRYASNEYKENKT